MSPVHHGSMNDRLSRIAPLVFRSAMVAGAIAFAIRVGRRFRRFAISGRSMLPTLSPGDWVLVDEHAYDGRMPRRGHVVVAEDPREPERHLVKRVAFVDLHGDVRLEGDNADESTDSREFGPIPAANVKGRVRWRYWPMGRAGAVG
jgi:nickel-type superoxide dismutase maturation protease